MTGITQNVGISIHAPVKGATETVAAGSPALVISIHAPVKGATRHAGRRCCRTGYFNPRSREGSDVKIGHASTCRSDFNPRSREGSDHADEWEVLDD